MASPLRCSPLFSPEDSDLAALKWRRTRDGYAEGTSNRCEADGRKVADKLRPHRMVAARILGRDLSAAECVDHINFDRLDNRRENLRVVTRQQNAQHRQPMSASGLRGVTYHKKTGKWQASVKLGDRSHYCGLHDTPDLAAAAAAAKRAELGFLSGVAA